MELVAAPFPGTGALPLTVPSGSSDPSSIPLYLFCIWVCGFSWIMVARLRLWRRIRAAVRASVPMNIPAPIDVRTSPGLMEPGVVGLLRPILLLPAGIEERLTPAQLAAVLAHEICHARRRDNLFAAFHMVVEAVFWFHPLVWWIGARLVEERERACDEGVLRLGSPPNVYAEAILNVCKLYVESPSICVAGVTGSDLKKRITAILSNQHRTRLSHVKKAALAMAAIVTLAAPLVVGMLRAQPQAKPRFEVASIRPCKDEPGLRRGAAPASPGRLNTGCIALADERHLGLIQRAYVRFADGVFHPMGIIPIRGGPDWIRSELYNIQATAEGAPPPALMEGPMLQALLEERFKLNVRRETEEGPVYDLVVSKGGPKLKQATDGSCVPFPSAFPIPPLPAGQEYCKAMIRLAGPVRSLIAEGSTIGEMSKLLNLVLDRPVIDKTGLTGKFSAQLDFAPDAVPDGPNGQTVPATVSGAPSIFTAIQEQLGLRLTPARGPRQYLTIDHVERPSEN